MRGSTARFGRRGRRAVDALRDRLRSEVLPPLLAIVLAGAGGYVGPAQPRDAAPGSRDTLSSARGPLAPEPALPSGVLAAPERALEALRIVAMGAQASIDGAVLYDAYVAAVRASPAQCHLSASVLAALGQAEPGPLGDTESTRDLAAAAAETAVSLCAHGRNLARLADLRAALLARTGSPMIVRLVLTLKARYDRMGLGLVGAPGPVLVPLLLVQATALVAEPYGLAVVYLSRARKDGVRLPESAADVREPTGPSAPQVTPDAQELGPPGSAAAVPVTPAGHTAEDEGPRELPDSASHDPAPGSASPLPVDEWTGPSDAPGSPEPPGAPQDPEVDVLGAACATEVAVEAPDADAPSSAPLTEVVDPADPGAATRDVKACATEPAPEGGAVTTEPDPSVDASATAAPEPAQATASTLP